MNIPTAYFSKETVPVLANKLDLPEVTLVCADCIHIDYAIAAIERCKASFNFGAVKLLTSMETDYSHKVEISPLNSLSDYSVFMLSRVHEFVDTSHMLVVQHDGWIINANKWEPSWLQMDYIAPLFLHKHTTTSTSVGSGGFSLRSKALMAFVAAQLPRWESSANTAQLMDLARCYEDGYISMSLRDKLLRAGFQIAPPHVAAQFAQGGNRDPAYHVERPFGFHGLWPNIDHDGSIDVTNWEYGQ